MASQVDCKVYPCCKISNSCKREVLEFHSSLKERVVYQTVKYTRELPGIEQALIVIKLHLFTWIMFSASFKENTKSI